MTIDPSFLGTSSPAHLALLSRSVNASLAGGGEPETSSQKFETGFADAITDHFDTTVFGLHAVPYSGPMMAERGWQYQQAGRWKTALQIVQNSRRQPTIVCFTGYDPFLVALGLVSQMFGARAFAFIYDTHLTAVAERSGLRALVIRWYYELGFWLAQFLSGWIVLNPKFAKTQVKTHPPLCHTKVGVNEMTPPSWLAKSRRSAHLSVVFAGTLNRENGTHVLCEALRQVPDLPIAVHIYGSGPMEQDIANYANNDPRVILHGRQPNCDVMSALMHCDYAIHLRDPRALSAPFAYPSKLIEYISIGCPVVSNSFPALGPTVKACLCAVTEFDAHHLAETLVLLDRDKTILDCHIDRSARHLQALLEAHHWPRLAQEIAGFFKKQGSLK